MKDITIQSLGWLLLMANLALSYVLYLLQDIRNDLKQLKKEN
jgi:hypothetical protein